MTSALAVALLALVLKAAGAPTPQSLAVAVEPATLRLGTDEVARVSVTGARSAPRWWASSGTVAGDLFHPGPRRAPGFAIVAADDGVRRGAAVVRLIGRGTLPTHTSPGADVSVLVGAVRFGPVRADAHGDAAVPVEVPPGVRVATVSAVDRDGMTTETTVTLPAEAPAPALVVAPRTLDPGERASVTVFALTGAGRWRPATAPAPVVVLDGALALRAPPRPVATGRWDMEIEARALASARDATIAVSLDGRPLPPASVRVRATGRAGPRLSLGARVGAATAFGPLRSLALAGEAALRHGPLALALEIGYARGSSSTFHGAAERVSLSQLTLALSGRVRLPLAALLAVELEGGAGLGLAAAAGTSVHAPIVFAGAALVRPVPGGEVVVDARWADARYDEFALRVEGNALGAMLTVGYRATLF